MNENAGKYRGMTIEEARKAAARDLEAQGLLIRTEAISHSVGHCQLIHFFLNGIISRKSSISHSLF